MIEIGNSPEQSMGVSAPIEKNSPGASPVPQEDEVQAGVPSETVNVSSSPPTPGSSIEQNKIAPKTVHEEAPEQESHVAGAEYIPIVSPATPPKAETKGFISRTINWFRKVLSFGTAETFDTLKKGQQASPFSTRPSGPLDSQNSPQNT